MLTETKGVEKETVVKNTYRIPPVMNRAQEIVAAMIALLTPEKAWTKGALAKDKDGHELNRPRSTAAVQWCLLGAVSKVGGTQQEKNVVKKTMTEIIGQNHSGYCINNTIVVFNDSVSTSRKDIFKLLRETFARLGKDKND